MKMPSEVVESSDSTAPPMMVSGLDAALVGLEEAARRRSVSVVVAGVPWRSPAERSGWTREDEWQRDSSTALEPPWRSPVGGGHTV